MLFPPPALLAPDVKNLFEVIQYDSNLIGYQSTSDLQYFTYFPHFSLRCIYCCFKALLLFCRKFLSSSPGVLRGASSAVEPQKPSQKILGPREQVN